ncbi:hypothetical protein TNCV_4221041 [Trichonephila clavipes]|nr:hypothetical protein TNCV_4221041 [Trichonephila clavipes]
MSMISCSGQRETSAYATFHVYAISPVFSSQASLVFIYRLTEGIKKAESTVRSPEFEPRTCGAEARYTTTQAPGFSVLLVTIRFSG